MYHCFLRVGWPNERTLRSRETAADLSARVKSITFTRRMTLYPAASANNRNAKFLQITQLEKLIGSGHETERTSTVRLPFESKWGAGVDFPFVLE
jgi:hypothetical protein